MQPNPTGGPLPRLMSTCASGRMLAIMAQVPALPVAPTVDHLSQAGPGAARCWDRCAAEWELGTGLAGLTSLSLCLPVNPADSEVALWAGRLRAQGQMRNGTSVPCLSHAPTGRLALALGLTPVW